MSISYSKNAKSYNRKELSQYLLTVFCFAIIFFISKWRTTDFSIETGIQYFVFVTIILLGATYLAGYVQKRAAFKRGYEADYENKPLFLLAGTVVSFLFQAFVLLLVPGQYILSTKKTRVGHFRPSLHERDIARISLYGALTYYLSGILFLILYALSGSFIFYEALKILLALAVFWLIPAPRNPGVSIFKWSPLALGISICIALGTVLLVFMGEPGFVISIILGGVGLLIVTLIDLVPRILYGS